MKFCFIIFLLIGQTATAQQSRVWVADQGNGQYKNPIINADYSDPDAIRVGDDYYMIASSFNHVPGLPILHSKDLVNWTLIGYALNQLIPVDHFSTVQHGGGVWAPSIRYHNKEFYIYYPDPDFGIYLTKAKSITGPWSDPVLVEAGKGLIDPCPFWDQNGKVYLVHAYAGSRAGIKSILVIKELNPAGTKVIAGPVMVYDGHATDPTIEGPKLYQRNGYYYIFAPAGGVTAGWQLVLRSKNILGPYERKVVMNQGTTTINGPHQGAWVNTQTGEDWFLHFQDKGAYGRVVHLQPMRWINNWPMIGLDQDQDGKGEPVTVYQKPNVGKIFPIQTIADNDEMNTSKLGLQWQWQANPQPSWAMTTNTGLLRMFSVEQADSLQSVWNNPNLLMQKLPAEQFTATVKLSFHPLWEGERFGLIVFGADYAYLSIVKKQAGNYLSFAIAKDADKGKQENRTEGVQLHQQDLYLRVMVQQGAICNFSYSEDGIKFEPFGVSFQAKQGRWVGAKIGLFFNRFNKTNDAGAVDIDWFHVE